MKGGPCLFPLLRVSRQFYGDEWKGAILEKIQNPERKDYKNLNLAEFDRRPSQNVIYIQLVSAIRGI